jgi:membrane-bound inhibitor of C-type lysozyme
MKRIAAFALAALLLAACAGAHHSSFARYERHDWRCSNGRAFSVRFDKKSRAELFAAGQVHVLAAAPAASGARYRDDAVEYWEHDGEARLTGAVGGPYEHCRQGS